MTLVNFKDEDNQNPSHEKVGEIRELASNVVSLLSPIFSPDSTLGLKPFKIDVGPPLLSWKAAYLPILNDGREVARLRAAASSILPRSLLCNIPDVIHSTILRFISRPHEKQSFVTKFESIAEKFSLGQATIDEVLLTAETKPYMIGGEILHRFSLRE
jgi:hypothetical protein